MKSSHTTRWAMACASAPHASSPWVVGEHKRYHHGSLVASSPRLTQGIPHAGRWYVSVGPRIIREGAFRMKSRHTTRQTMACATCIVHCRGTTRVEPTGHG